MLKGFKYEIFPTEEQILILANYFGLNRLVWNSNLANYYQNQKDRHSGKIGEKDYYKIQNYKPMISSLENGKEIMKAVKDYSAAGWIASSSQNLSKAINNHFSKKRKSNTKKPNFKSKHKRQSITNCMCSVKFKKNNLVKVTKELGWIKFDNHRFCEGKPTGTVTISYENNKYYISIQVEIKQNIKNQNGKTVAIDWNCRDEAWLTLSNDTKIKCPRFMLVLQKKLQKEQRKLSKLFKPGQVQSNHYIKQKYRVSKLHRRIANQRKDFLWKLAKSLTSQYETIVFENINLQKMAKSYKHKGLNHGKVISDQGFGKLRSICEYLGHVEYVPSAYTSKKCSHCGEIANFVRVGVDEWVCPKCGVRHDRDINAAKNILKIYLDRVGTSQIQADGDDVRLMKNKQLSMKSETIPSHSGEDISR